LTARLVRQAGFLRPANPPASDDGVLRLEEEEEEEEDPSRKWSEEDLRDMGVALATARRHFQRRFAPAGALTLGRFMV
jgi:methylphosphotriester-DNA--protein-cysteine methyltransferase